MLNKKNFQEFLDLRETIADAVLNEFVAGDFEKEDKVFMSVYIRPDLGEVQVYLNGGENPELDGWHKEYATDYEDALDLALNYF